MNLLDDLKELGVEVEVALKLLSNNTALYEDLLGTFVKMVREIDIRPDDDNCSDAELLEKAHKLKGVAGNLALTPLYESYSKIVSLLRENQPEQAKKVLVDMLPIQEQIIHCIESHN